MLYPLANLESEKLSAVQALEKEIGGPVLALAGVEAQTSALQEEHLEKLQQLEAKLGIVLVAVRPN